MAGGQLAYSVVPSLGHDLAGHYECAKRIPAIVEALQKKRLTADAQPQKVRTHDLINDTLVLELWADTASLRSWSRSLQ